MLFFDLIIYLMTKTYNDISTSIKLKKYFWSCLIFKNTTVIKKNINNRQLKKDIFQVKVKPRLKLKKISSLVWDLQKK